MQLGVTKINRKIIMVEFTGFDEIFLKKSAEWLADPAIKYLTASPSIDEYSQRKWYESLKNRNDYVIYGVRYQGKPIGVVGLKHIDLNRRQAEYFGYIGEKEMWGRGVGTRMMEYIEEVALVRNIRRIYLKVIENNTNAIGLYKKMQYKYDSSTGGLILMSKCIKEGRAADEDNVKPS